MSMVSKVIFGGAGRLLVAAVLLGGGIAPLASADNAPKSNAAASVEAKELELSLSVMQGKAELVKQLLADGVNVNAVHYDKLTPLSLAIAYNRLEILPILLEAPGVDVNKSCPLFYAIREGKEVVVTQLLAAGADVNAEYQNNTPLISAILYGRVTIVERLLATPGIDVNKTTLETADTPLHKAAWKGSRQIIPLLLAVPGIDVNAKNAAGDTPLKLAEKFGYPRCAEMIRAAGGKK